MVGVTREMAQRDVRTRRGNGPGNHQAIQSNFGWAPLYLPIQSRDELQRGKDINWVKKLPEVVLALNSEKTRLTGKKPVDAIQEKVVDTKNVAGEPVLFYLKDSPRRGFVREELKIVPLGTKLPHEGIRRFEKHESTPPSFKRIIFTLCSELA
ncbi:hypothetical protein pdam_00006352, partial [Pocillopora damicornis]